VFLAPTNSVSPEHFCVMIPQELQDLLDVLETSKDSTVAAPAMVTEKGVRQSARGPLGLESLLSAFTFAALWHRRRLR
jgi:hypothetical protein